MPEKADRVFHFHRNTLHALSEMIAAAGLQHPSEIGPHHLVRRASPTEIRLFAQLHSFLMPGDLISGGEAMNSIDQAGAWRGRTVSILRGQVDRLLLTAAPKRIS